MRQYIHDHPGIAITFIYLYLSFVGLVYQYFHLQEFGLNLFDFSTTNDYLIAFLKSLPFLLVLVFLYLLIFTKDVLFNQKHAPGDTFKERLVSLIVMSRKLEFILFVVALPVFSGWIGNVRGNGLSGHSLIEIKESTAKEIGTIRNVYLLDTTHDYIFIATESERFVLKRDKLESFRVNSSNKSGLPYCPHWFQTV